MEVNHEQHPEHPVDHHSDPDFHSLVTKASFSRQTSGDDAKL
jgi:hypothetical protein